MRWLAATGLGQLAAGIAAIVLVYAALGLAALSFHSDGLAKQDERLAQLDRLRSVAAYKPKLDTLGENAAASGFSASFLPGGPPAVVSANLLDLLKQMAAMQGVEVLQAEGLPPKPLEGLTLVGGKVQMVGPMSAVMGLLKAIEEAEPLLVTERLSVRNTRPGGEVAAAETYLSVELEVFGALRGTPRAENGQGG